jgi:predicted small lipoprotein YifL
MRMHSVVVSLIGLSVLALAGCGGSKQPAEEPSAEKSAPPEETKKDEAKSDDAKKEEAKVEAKSDTKAADSSSPEVKRTAKDIITAPEVTFMFNFNDSEPKEKAEKACSAEAGDDAKKMALCMKKASGKFEADGMQFKKDNKGQWVWVTIRRKGSSVTVLHNIPIEFGDDKPTSVVIKPVGKDTGKQPSKQPSEVVVEVPNEFEIALKDPAHGRMVYEAKIGIMSDDKAK